MMVYPPDEVLKLEEKLRNAVDENEKNEIRNKIKELMSKESSFNSPFDY